MLMIANRQLGPLIVALVALITVCLVPEQQQQFAQAKTLIKRHLLDDGFETRSQGGGGFGLEFSASFDARAGAAEEDSADGKKQPSERAATVPTVKKDLKEDEANEEHSDGSTTSQPQQKDGDSDDGDESEEVTASSTTTVAPKKAGKSRSSELEVEEEKAGSDSPAVILTIRGTRKPKKHKPNPVQDGTTSTAPPTTVGPTVIIGKNGTSSLQQDGTAKPLPEETSSELIKKYSSAISSSSNSNSNSSSTASNVVKIADDILNLPHRLVAKIKSKFKTGSSKDDKKNKTTQQTSTSKPAAAVSTKSPKAQQTDKPTTTGPTKPATPATTTTLAPKPTTTTLEPKPTTTAPGKATTALPAALDATITTTVKPSTNLATTVAPPGNTSSTKKPKGKKKRRRRKKKKNSNSTTVSPNGIAKVTTPSMVSTTTKTDASCKGKSLLKVKSRDKLVALVQTKEGSFNFRRVNRKTIAKLMQGRIDDSQKGNVIAGKPVLLASNNSYVLPEGTYYMPRPMRLIGMNPQ